MRNTYERSMTLPHINNGKNFAYFAYKKMATHKNSKNPPNILKNNRA